MNSPHRFLDSGSESQRLDSRSQILHLLAGLERQKEELGPIADELIELLHRLGVGIAPQTYGKSQLGKP
jgi:hypothetical protein